MASNKNKLSSLLNQLTSTNVGGMNLSKSLKPTSLLGSSTSGTEEAGKPPSLGDSKSVAMGTKSTPTGIQFGRPSSNRTASTNSGSEWTNLLKQSASGGIASALSGGLSSIAGLGGLVSGLMSLFGGGGKSTPPPLVEFQLPNSVSQTVYASSKGSTVYQGNSVETPSTSTAGGSGTSTSQSLQYQSTAVAQAVKTALLNSSSLNDVITEI